MFNYDEIFNAPTLKDIYPTAEILANELKELVNDEYILSFIEKDNLLLSFNKLFLNLLNVYGSHKINSNEEQFKSNFKTLYIDLLPIYTAYFNGYSLNAFKNQEAFNEMGESNYSGGQNNENKIKNISNFDNFNLKTFTPDEKIKQAQEKTNKINEFVYSFTYLFNGVK